jgi:hypothetical protein
MLKERAASCAVILLLHQELAFMLYFVIDDVIACIKTVVQMKDSEEEEAFVITSIASVSPRGEE